MKLASTLLNGRCVRIFIMWIIKNLMPLNKLGQICGTNIEVSGKLPVDMGL